MNTQMNLVDQHAPCQLLCHSPRLLRCTPTSFPRPRCTHPHSRCTELRALPEEGCLTSRSTEPRRREVRRWPWPGETGRAELLCDVHVLGRGSSTAPMCDVLAWPRVRFPWSRRPQPRKPTTYRYRQPRSLAWLAHGQSGTRDSPAKRGTGQSPHNV